MSISLPHYDPDDMFANVKSWQSYFMGVNPEKTTSTSNFFGFVIFTGHFLLVQNSVVFPLNNLAS